MAQQTAVEWLVKQIKSDHNQKALSASEWMQVIEQAKQIEKEQIITAHLNGQAEFDKEEYRLEVIINAGKYYNETYNK